MRLKLLYEFEHPKIPVSYRRAIMAFIKKALCEYDQKRFDNLYDQFACKRKSYSFAVSLPPGSCFLKDRIHLNGNSVILYLSTADFSDLILLYNAFMEQVNKPFLFPLQNKLTLKKIENINVQPIFTDSVNIRMLSPLVLRNHDRETNKDQYVIFSDSNFNDHFKSVTSNMLKDIQMNFDSESLMIEPLQAKKTVISEFDTRFAVSIGNFRLSGNPELLTFLQYSGAGSRRSQGFGLFKVL
ncbi:MAG: CRISPR-associated endoribonuclease Cas6 [Eubacteriaceae bacterium]|jgi:CRISPR-associated endoribonuclease Cas6|nr:CRISPR-associated endoribonuclease Cas6 [Eubacteriaceae bacterium]